MLFVPSVEVGALKTYSVKNQDEREGTFGTMGEGAKDSQRRPKSALDHT